MRKISLFVVVPLAAVLLCRTSLAAEAGYPQLRGVDNFYLVIEDLLPLSERCGFNGADLRSAAMFPLSSAKFTVAPLPDKNAENYPLYYVYVTIGKSGPRCFGSIVTEALHYQYVKSVHTNTDQWVAVILWRTNQVFIASTNNLKTPLVKLIETMTKEFITEWNLANK